ncbi:hypothetical protein SAMN05443245_5271 [Paraburkholderia fungorum]|uniref:Uncharacterized protein n=1 Tax=Paraburkholderia fungorum TaxID=134537 RepID=A0A1H1IJS4_9BURK|nr:hypothetical protein [Paraburkholderia fungorum]SDR37829.1 hypothetical protein SAMN05443245_5271 [Paraburkholderia fungorum]
MIRLALCLLLGGCTSIQILPSLNTTTYDVNGALIYIEPDPMTNYSAAVTYSTTTGYKLKLGAKWKF